MEKYAIVTIVFGDEQYIIGALCLAQSLRLVGTKSDIVCMVTNDISEEAILALKQLYTKVKLVDYIKHDTVEFSSTKTNQRYSHWINASFTKWRCLELVEYKSIVFMDADMICVQNFDDLFTSISPPATIFSNSLSAVKSYIMPQESSARHGELIPLDIPEVLLLNSYQLVNGAFCMLKPMKELADVYVAYLAEHKMPYGTGHPFNGVDEQILIDLFSFINKRLHKNFIQWTNISISYSMVPWNKAPLAQGDKVHNLHYLKVKPWKQSPTEWPDLSIWYSILHVVAMNLKLRNYLKKFDIMLDFIDNSIKCAWCNSDTHKMFKIENDNTILSILCPHMVG